MSMIFVPSSLRNCNYNPNKFVRRSSPMPPLHPPRSLVCAFVHFPTSGTDNCPAASNWCPLPPNPRHRRPLLPSRLRARLIRLILCSALLSFYVLFLVIFYLLKLYLRTTNVYINGLPPHFKAEQLYALTAQFGTVLSCRTFARQLAECPS